MTGLRERTEKALDRFSALIDKVAAEGSEDSTHAALVAQGQLTRLVERLDARHEPEKATRPEAEITPEQREEVLRGLRGMARTWAEKQGEAWLLRRLEAVRASRDA